MERAAQLAFWVPPKNEILAYLWQIAMWHEGVVLAMSGEALLRNLIRSILGRVSVLFFEWLRDWLGRRPGLQLHDAFGEFLCYLGPTSSSLDDWKSGWMVKHSPTVKRS